MAKINWKEGLSLERDVAEIIQRQEQHGVYFDIGKAHFLISHLEELKEELYKQIRPFLMYDIQNQENKQHTTKEKLEKATEEELILLTNEYSCVRKIKLKNGCYTPSILNHFNDSTIVAGPFSRIQIEEPSIGKRQLIVKQLLKLGWKPTEFTEKGFPQLTIKGEPVESLLKVGSFGKDLSLWYTYSHRQSQIKGFLPHVRSDGRISAQLDPCATNTFRGAHRVVANIPRPTSIFGKEMRSLFTVPDDKVFVGADVSGLELRMLAHHMRDPEYIKQILEGDIHSYNQEKAGLPTRDDAKTFIYGFL